MKKTLLLVTLLPLIASGEEGTYPAPLSQPTVRGQSGKNFEALDYTQDGGSVYLTTDGTSTGGGVDFTSNNIYFNGSGTTTVQGGTVDNSAAPASNGRTPASYAFIVAGGEVVLSGVQTDEAVDWQTNLSVGTAYTEGGSATLTIQDGSRIKTTAYYNGIGSNGTMGIVNVTGQGTELHTQQLTLGCGTEGLAAYDQSETYGESKEHIYWIPKYLYETADYSRVVANFMSQDCPATEKGYGKLNITDGAVMTVGVGNTNSSNNRLQIYNGEVNVDKARLTLGDASSLSMDANYGASTIRNLQSTLRVTGGGIVNNEGTLHELSAGILYTKGNTVYDYIIVEGEGSQLDLKSQSMAMGQRFSATAAVTGGSSTTALEVKDGATAQFTIAHKIEMANDAASNTNRVDISVTGKGSALRMEAANVYFNNDDATTNTVNLAVKGGGRMEIAATGGEEEGVGAIGMRSGTTLTVQDAGSVLATTGEWVMSGTASGEIGAEALWQATSVTLQDTARIINNGTITAAAFSLSGGATFINEGLLTTTDSVTMAAGSKTVFEVSLAQEGTSPLTSTKVALGGTAEDGSPYAGTLTLVDGALFELDLSGVAAGYYEGIRLVLAEGFEGSLPDTNLDLLLENTTFTGNTVESYDLAYSVQEGSLVLSGSMRIVPEPATATLSLLALAALAARRRRK